MANIIDNIQADVAEDLSDEILQLVTFKIGDEEFAVDILQVQEIIKMPEYTRVPNSPRAVVGVINLRGKVIPVLDFRLQLGLEQREADRMTRIAVVEIKSRVIGFIVDQVSEVIRVNKSITEAPPAMVSGISSEYITSIGKLDERLLIMLDLEKILFADTEENTEDKS